MGDNIAIDGRLVVRKAVDEIVQDHAIDLREQKIYLPSLLAATVRRTSFGGFARPASVHPSLVFDSPKEWVPAPQYLIAILPDMLFIYRTDKGYPGDPRGPLPICHVDLELESGQATRLILNVAKQEFHALLADFPPGSSFIEGLKRVTIPDSFPEGRLSLRFFELVLSQHHNQPVEFLRQGHYFF